ncbi:armadillo-type protein [Catenaria anguillulae PL171]|uniref:Armadillo-type protein n=1 Tax=Catenaria anguillulae PL171 TaxID=765915 RepID=A0A1Y2HBV9_9FUNG|nr:armadillo-type protein [Catenaria anguillulae PL171]
MNSSKSKSKTLSNARASANKPSKSASPTTSKPRKRSHTQAQSSATPSDAARPTKKHKRAAPARSESESESDSDSDSDSHDHHDSDSASVPQPSSMSTSTSILDSLPMATTSSLQSTIDAIDPALARKLAALANKLSESNLEPLATDLEQLYSSYPRQAVTSALTAQILASVAEKVHLHDTFVMTYAALLALAGTSIGQEVVAGFVQAAVTKWLGMVEGEGKDGEPDRQQREAANVLVLIGHLYNFGLVGCGLVYDMVRELCAEVTEDKVELVLKLVKLCGLQLRHDDPSSLRDMSSLLTTSATSHLASPLSFRLKFMLETVSDLAAGKAARHLFFSPTDHPLFKLAANAHRRRPGLLKLEPLRPTLDDIKHVKTRGMWWRVGSAWVGHDTQKIKQAAAKAKTSESKLLQLARAHGMNTDVRRAVFVAVMSAEDYLDAYERVTKLGLTEKQEREVVRVVVHCLQQEKAFNAYYAVLVQHLCSVKHAHKITLQYTLWDYLKDEAGSAPEVLSGAGSKEAAKYSRKLAIMAKLVAHLVRTGAVPMAVLRILDPTRLSNHQVRFLRVFVPEVRRVCEEGSGLVMASLPSGVVEGVVDLDDGGRRGRKTEQGEVKSMLKVADELQKNLERYAVVD